MRKYVAEFIFTFALAPGSQAQRQARHRPTRTTLDDRDRRPPRLGIARA